MTAVYIHADNIVSPVGNTSGDNFRQLLRSVSGIKQHPAGGISPEPFQASLLAGIPVAGEHYTRFENLLIASIADALAQSQVQASDPRTVLILSTTKGNISLLETEPFSAALSERISLNTSARLVAAHFGFANRPVIVSNACISGILALLTGMRLIQSGQYDHAVVAGADLITRFVLSGFQSFQAVSSSVCKPFDAARDGINLGEGAATIILTSSKQYASGMRIGGGATSNDANHISGPSRTGEELNMAIGRSLRESGLRSGDIGFISAHGTATIYNDEMEAKAINLAGLQHVPVNSLKGYYGHTLGAAGLIESVITLQSMKEDTILPTPGFTRMGVTQPVNVCTSLLHTKLRNSLKTASGFGGCNAAMIFSKE